MLEKSIIEILKYTTMEQKEVLLDILNLLRNNLNLNENTNKSATMTVLGCSKYSGIGQIKIRELIDKSNTDFPYFKIGARVLINRNEFDKWLIKISEEHRKL